MVFKFLGMLCTRVPHLVWRPGKYLKNRKQTGKISGKKSPRASSSLFPTRRRRPARDGTVHAAWMRLPPKGLCAAAAFWLRLAIQVYGGGGIVSADAIDPRAYSYSKWGAIHQCGAIHPGDGSKCGTSGCRPAWVSSLQSGCARTSATARDVRSEWRRRQQQQNKRLSPTVKSNGRLCIHVPVHVMRGGHSAPLNVPSYRRSRMPRPSFGGSRALSLGASSSPREEGIGRTEQQSRLRKVGMSTALFATYYCVMFAKCSLPATLSLLVGDNSGLRFLDSPSSMSPPQNAQAAMARVLSLSTIFLSIGKLLLGPFIDAATGIFCLKLSLFALSCCLGTICQTTTFRHFALAWICVDFVFSACWAACLNAIHSSFEEEEWPGAIGMLAIAARTGNASAFLIFGALLGNVADHGGATIWTKFASRDESWRVVFALSALIQTIPIILLSIVSPQKGLLSKANSDDARKDVLDAPNGSTAQASGSGRATSIHESLRILRSVASEMPFWLHLVSRAALMVFASFLMFVPSLMSNCFGLSSALAAKTGSLYALGCLLAVSIGSKPYNNLDSRSKIVTNAVQLGTATFSTLTLLLHVRGAISLPPSFGMFLMFIWGGSFAVPFYIPSSIFALERGGKKSSATISDFFDFFGFLCLAIFNGHAASIQQNVMIQWSLCFVILASCSATSLVCLTLLELISD